MGTSRKQLNISSLWIWNFYFSVYLTLFLPWTKPKYYQILSFNHFPYLYIILYVILYTHHLLLQLIFSREKRINIWSAITVYLKLFFNLTGLEIKKLMTSPWQQWLPTWQQEVELFRLKTEYVWSSGNRRISSVCYLTWRNWFPNQYDWILKT